AEERFPRDAQRAHLARQAVRRGKPACPPFVFPAAPGCVGREALDDAVQHVAHRDGVVEIEEQDGRVQRVQRGQGGYGTESKKAAGLAAPGSRSRWGVTRW